MNTQITLACSLANGTTEANSEMKRQIPEALRQHFSKIGKKGAAAKSHEDRVKAGQRSWESRLAKAREAQKTKDTNATEPDHKDKAAA